MSIKITDENGNVINGIPGPAYMYSFPIGTTCDNRVPNNIVDKEEHKHRLVNNPPHYNKHPSGIECIQITRHMNFNLGNAIKYIWRADLKNDAIEDLKKAAWYIQDEIQRREKR